MNYELALINLNKEIDRLKLNALIITEVLSSFIGDLGVKDVLVELDKRYKETHIKLTGIDLETNESVGRVLVTKYSRIESSKRWELMVKEGGKKETDEITSTENKI